MKGTIFVTGATGNVGGATVKSDLVRSSEDLKLVVGARDVDRARKELDFRSFNP